MYTKYGFLFFFTHAEGGEWLVAYRAEQRRQLRAVLSSLPVPDADEVGSGGGGGDANEETPHDTQRSCLNEEFVLHHLHADSPSDVAEINISGCGLLEVCRRYSSTLFLWQIQLGRCSQHRGASLSKLCNYGYVASTFLVVLLSFSFPG